MSDCLPTAVIIEPLTTITVSLIGGRPVPSIKFPHLIILVDTLITTHEV